MTNVVPLLAQADTIESGDLDALKQSISDELGQLGIPYFTFTTDDPPTPPYAVCSAPSSDEDNMDASLLMSSDYIQPLLPSELGMLIDQLLDKDNIARMRHLSAKKLVQSKAAVQLMNSATTILGHPNNPAPTNSSLASQILTTSTLRPPLHSQLRLAEYTRREEKLAQIRLAKWANDLRRTMRDERAQFEAVQQVDRTTWLSQKLEECTHNAASSIDRKMIRSELAGHSSSLGLTNPNDPLGLLRCDEYLRQHGLRIFQVVGTFGVFGAMAVWAARNWEGLSEWSWTWGECRTWTY